MSHTTRECQVSHCGGSCICQVSSGDRPVCQVYHIVEKCVSARCLIVEIGVAARYHIVEIGVAARCPTVDSRGQWLMCG